MSDDTVRRGPGSKTSVTEWRTAGEETLVGLTGSRYRLLGLVGTGGMGVVYRAEDTLLRRTVALKFLPPMLTPNPRAKARFLNEARAASALDHPNICTIYEVGETAEGQLYLAMAFYEGETLKHRLEHGSLSVAEALHIALQVARGLARAHHQGIVHRDIKPANLMLTTDGMVKILDFGIARLPDQTLSGLLLGTPGYMSPEQARFGTVDARSDVWSLGVVLREMLTGWRPGHGEPPEAPPGIDGLLSRMLAEEPADRYPDAAALLADLSALERTAAGTEGTPSLGPARRRLPAWVPILVVVALAATVGVWLLQGVRWPGEAGPDPRRATLTRLTDLSGLEKFPSLTPDGNFFVYARKGIAGCNRLFLQQVGGGAPLDLLPNSQCDSQPAVSPDGRQIAFRSEREGGGIFVMGLMGESVRRVTNFGFNPAWSPDGKEIVCATEPIVHPLERTHNSQIYRVSLATGQRRLVHIEGDATQPSWSPHGVRIAYWGTSPLGHQVIWTVPADGGKAVQVTAGTHSDWNPVWSPDGRYLYFVSIRSGAPNLWRVQIDERSGRVRGEPEPVTTSGSAGMLSLSRDGRRIVFEMNETRTIIEKVAFEPARDVIAGPAVTIAQSSNLIEAFDASRDGRWLVYQTILPQEELFIVHSDGTGLRQLTHDEFKDRLPRWSPDGTRIAFYSNRGGKYEIWTIRADGSQPERAAVIPGRPAYHPIWSPDGRWLAIELDENEALIDLSVPVAERRPLLLPLADGGMGFSASSWSADGRWLAGVLHHPDGWPVTGIVLYSLADRSYTRFPDFGQWPAWLSDSRHLVYRAGDQLVLLDTVSRVSRQVLTIPPGSDFTDFCLSPDDRFLYLSRHTEQGEIWMLTMK